MGASLFVYGTLRPGSDQPMAAWLAARSEPVGPARLKAVLVDLGTYPGLVEGDGVVHGMLLTLHGDEVLAELDRYEGVPDLFVRESRTVAGPSGPVRAWVYRYVGPETGLPVRSGTWSGQAPDDKL